MAALRSEEDEAAAEIDVRKVAPRSTLDALYPGRIDLGLGRAPGTGALTAHALRRTLSGDVDAFPDDVQELIGYFDADQTGRRVRAFPGEGRR